MVNNNHLSSNKSSHQRCSVKKVFLEIHRKTPVSPVSPAPACNFIKKETLAQVFSCEFCKISKNIFFTEHLRKTTSVIILSVTRSVLILTWFLIVVYLIRILNVNFWFIWNVSMTTFNLYIFLLNNFFSLWICIYFC